METLTIGPGESADLPLGETRVVVKMGGQPAGDPALELLRDPLNELLADAVAFASRELWARQGLRLDEALPHFESGIVQARSRATLGRYRRSEMPVIEEADLEDLRRALAERDITDICDVCEVNPTIVIPTQCQLYVDKSVAGTAKFGLEGTRKFLQSNHLVISQEGLIIDGHHRWLSAYLIDPGMSLPAFRVRAPLQSILGLMIDFSDARHQRNM